MFIDASAIVAIIKAEPEAAGFLKAIEARQTKIFCSPVARFEAVASLAVQLAMVRGRKQIDREDQEAAEGLVADFLAEIGARDIHITEGMGAAARSAALAYGKASGHPAGLNMGDCFAYACAKAYHVSLLYSGSGFQQTDLE